MQGILGNAKENCDKVIKIEKKGDFFCMAMKFSNGIFP